MKLEDAVEKIAGVIYTVGSLLAAGLGVGYFVLLKSPETFFEFVFRLAAGLLCGLLSWCGVGILICLILGKGVL